MLRGLFLVLAILLVVETEALPKVIKIGEYMNLVMQLLLLRLSHKQGVFSNVIYHKIHVNWILEQGF